MIRAAYSGRDILNLGLDQTLEKTDPDSTVKHNRSGYLPRQNTLIPDLIICTLQFSLAMFKMVNNYGEKNYWIFEFRLSQDTDQ